MALSRYGYAYEESLSSGGPERRSGASFSSCRSSPSRVVVLLLFCQPFKADYALAGSFRLGPTVPHLKQRIWYPCFVGITDTVVGAWLQSADEVFTVFSLMVDLMPV